MKYFRVGESIGIYPTGVNPDGKNPTMREI